jgi:hypothetical protein
MRWVGAKEVLPHEAHDFTPWLADNLDLLADVLGLDQLELVATEWKVETFALDVLARGSDADGEVNVVIENQYGFTDHRHLGQILTYAAHAAAGGHRVLALWLTEEVRPAHLAAVEFINRVASEGSTFGMLLLRVRFAPAPAGFHVYFEVESEPNAFLSQPTPGPGAKTPGDAARAAFIEAVVAELDPLLEPTGLRRRGAIQTRFGAATYRFPAKLEVARVATARVICSAETTNVALFLERYPDSRMNWAAAELLRRSYAPLLDQYGLHVDTWHGSGPKVKRDRVITRLPIGYASGDQAETATDVATQAGNIISRWTDMFTNQPIAGIDEEITSLAETAGAMTSDDTDAEGTDTGD